MYLTIFFSWKLVMQFSAKDMHFEWMNERMNKWINWVKRREITIRTVKLYYVDCIVMDQLHHSIWASFFSRDFHVFMVWFCLYVLARACTRMFMCADVLFSMNKSVFRFVLFCSFTLLSQIYDALPLFCIR